MSVSVSVSVCVKEREKKCMCVLFAATQSTLMSSSGVTAVHDMGRYPWDALGSQPWGDLHDVYLPLARDGQLKTRVCAFMPLSTWCV